MVISATLGRRHICNGGDDMVTSCEHPSRGHQDDAQDAVWGPKAFLISEPLRLSASIKGPFDGNAIKIR